MKRSFVGALPAVQAGLARSPGGREVTRDLPSRTLGSGLGYHTLMVMPGEYCGERAARGARLSSGRGWGPPSQRQGEPGEGGEEGKVPRPPPPPGPPRSRSCSGPAAAPPGSARQAPPARRGRGWGVDAGAYAFARERVQEGPGGRHLAVVARGPRGVAQAAHGAGGVLGAAPVSARVPCPRPPAPAHPTCRTSPSAARPCRSSLREKNGRLRCAAPREHPRPWAPGSLRAAPFPWSGSQDTSRCRSRGPR